MTGTTTASASATETPRMVEFEVARVDATHEEVGDDVVTPEGVEEPIIHCFGYDADGQYHHVKIRGFEPYCYCRYEDHDAAREMSGTKRVELYDDDDEEFQSVRGERLVKVVTYQTSGVSDLTSSNDVSPTWESDVLFPHRFITDMDLSSGIRVLDNPDEEYVHVKAVQTKEVDAEWRVHCVDIEVDDRAGFPEGGDEPILCITAYDNFLDEYIVWIQGEGEDADYAETSELHGSDVSVRWFDDEVAMLRNYFAFVSGSHPAIITGWNVDDFDLPYLFDRAEVLADERDTEVPHQAMSPLYSARDHDFFGLRVKGIAVFDLLQGFKATQYTDLDSYRLDDVAEAFVGHTKDTFVGKIGQMWEDDPSRLVDYNLRDVELCVELDRQEQVISFWQEVKRYGRCQLSDAPIESNVVDKYLLNQLHGDRALPRQGSADNVSGSYSGGAVFSAYNGLAENVSVLDLASLYPMSMLTLNASPETKVDPDEYDGETLVSPNGIHFRTDQTGITRQLIVDLLDKRDAKKAQRDEHDPESNQYAVYDRQQRALKVIMNSLYGVMAWNRFRLYDPDVARAVTATGREVLDFTATVVEDEYGYDVLYGDTDSCLIELPDDMAREDIIAECHDIAETINVRYADFASEALNADDHRFEIEFEKLYRRYFQSGQKKRYAGHIVWKEGKDVDDLDITGYEYKRSDTAPIAARVQEETLRQVVTDATPDEIARYLSKELSKFDRREVTLDEIGLPEGIGRRMDNYTSPTHSVRAAKHGNLLLGTSFSKGSKPRRYYIDDMDEAFFKRIEAEEGLDAGRDPLYAQFRESPRYVAVEDAEQLPPETQLNWSAMKTKTLNHSMSRIINALGLDWDELDSDGYATTLDDFAADADA